MHCRMFSSIFGLYPLDASSTFPSCDNEKCLHVLPKVPEKQNYPRQEPLNQVYTTQDRESMCGKQGSLEGKVTLRMLLENYPDLEEMFGLPQRGDPTQRSNSWAAHLTCRITYNEAQIFPPLFKNWQTKREEGKSKPCRVFFNGEFYKNTIFIHTHVHLKAFYNKVRNTYLHKLAMKLTSLLPP